MKPKKYKILDLLYAPHTADEISKKMNMNRRAVNVALNRLKKENLVIIVDELQQEGYDKNGKRKTWKQFVYTISGKCKLMNLECPQTNKESNTEKLLEKIKELRLENYELWLENNLLKNNRL